MVQLCSGAVGTRGDKDIVQQLQNHPFLSHLQSRGRQVNPAPSAGSMQLVSSTGQVLAQHLQSPRLPSRDENMEAAAFSSWMVFHRVLFRAGLEKFPVWD